MCAARFNFVIQEKTRILDDIFRMALPKQKNPLAMLPDMAKINNQFLDKIKEDSNAYQSKISTLGMSGNLHQRLTYLNLMHKSLSIVQKMLAKKVQEVQNQHHGKVKKRFSPRNVVLPTSMESGLIIEDFELDKNYFQKLIPI